MKPPWTLFPPSSSRAEITRTSPVSIILQTYFYTQTGKNEKKHRKKAYQILKICTSTYLGNQTDWAKMRVSRKRGIQKRLF